jgi:hypothetical protein
VELHQIIGIFRDQIKTIFDINRLQTMKEELQDQVPEPSHDWQARMVIYKKVQLIIERIEELKNTEV